MRGDGGIGGRKDSGKTEDRKPHLYTDLWQPGTELCGSPEKKKDVSSREGQDL